MTIREFNKTMWHADMKVEILSGVHKGKILNVVSPNFDQQLIGCQYFPDEEEPTWFRCENCKLVEV